MTSFLKHLMSTANPGPLEHIDAPEHEPQGRRTPVRALPGPWYYTAGFYDLERRAIFSRHWLMITHTVRFVEPGDFLRYEIAGYDIVLNMDRQRNIRAFHNVCRHRAYQIVEKDSGRASIFACRYHGWSYGLNGNLAKAPEYDKVDGFKKEEHGLFKIHVHVDHLGFIWVNLDARDTPEISWDDQFKNVDRQPRFTEAGFDFNDYVFDHTYQLEGDFNWKLLADNFNECYHCKTTHPDVPSFLTIDSHDVELKDGHMQHDHASTDEQKARGFNVNSTYYFPNASMSVAPHWLMIQKFLPMSPTRSKMHYEIYRNKHSALGDFKMINDIYARVMSEDKVLCLGAQRNIERGVFMAGELHPRWEKGPLYFQSQCRKAVTEHWETERASGKVIWPARPGMGENGTSENDLAMCAGTMCGDSQEQLAW